MKKRIFHSLFGYLIFQIYIQEYTNVEREDTCKMDVKCTESPTPKLRTKFSNNDEVQDIPITRSQCVTVLDNTDTTKPSENKDSNTIRSSKSPNLKWKRRSIKQSKDESDDDTEKGNNLL